MLKNGDKILRYSSTIIHADKQLVNQCTITNYVKSLSFMRQCTDITLIGYTFSIEINRLATDKS